MSDTTRRTGWAFGERIPATSPYLTIIGSHYREPALLPTRKAAEAALEASPLARNPHLSLEVRRVTRVSRDVFRITP